MNRIRAAAVIIKDGKVLLMHRIKDGREYFVFPGGKTEDTETPEEAMVREVHEEVTLEVLSIDEEIVKRTNDEGNTEIYYLVTSFSGNVALGGEEKEIMNESNQYYPEWWDISEARSLSNLYPAEILSKLN